MLRLDFDRNVDQTCTFIKTSRTPSEIAWHNLKEIASIHNLELVIASATAWFRSNPTKTIQDLESLFRSEKIPVHLIAKPPEQIDSREGTVELIPINSELRPETYTPKYSLVYSCRPDPLAKKELLNIWSSYEENFLHLEESGIYQIKKDSPGDVQHKALRDVQHKALRDNDIVTMVSHNMVTLRLRNLTDRQVNDEMNSDISEATRISGKPSEAKTIGTALDGTPVLAHFIDDKVISVYGLMIGSNKQVKIILVNDKSTWTGFVN